MTGQFTVIGDEKIAEINSRKVVYPPVIKKLEGPGLWVSCSCGSLLSGVTWIFVLS